MSAQAPKPNVVIIMTDQQRADAIGCMGNDAVISPNLDALAAGVLLGQEE